MTGPEAGGPLRILLLNWQDRENPQAGGAEIHLHEIFGRLAAYGHQVRAVVGGWRGAERCVRIDGIDVVRVGGRHSFAVRARGAALRVLRDWPADVVVEDINKIPLYSPLWAGRPVVALVPHLFGRTAFKEASAPVAAVVWLAERAIPRVYVDCPFQAISESTALDLTARGVRTEAITVIPPGIDHETYRPGSTADRAGAPTVLYVGRLKRYKGIEVLFEAFVRLRGQTPDARLVIMGRGDDEGRLESIARDLGLQDRVEFLGYASEAEKVMWLRRAWVLAYPSPNEGWGIANVEAAACGTPVVASDAPGLRESVHVGESGLLVAHGDADSWTRALGEVLGDPALRDRLGKGGIAHAAQFSWDRAARETEAHLHGVLARP